MKPHISIIIPTLNEERKLPETLAVILDNSDCEIIIADGASSDETLSLAEKAGCKTVTSAKGRGRQMNVGVSVARGRILLFLHADTLLPPDSSQLILEAFEPPRVAAGAFSLGFDSPEKSLKFIAWGANLRSKFLQFPYGDQALFTSRKNFDTIGGFPEMEIMEDFVFVQRIRKLGKIVTLSEKVSTSARRWQNMGILRTTLINQFIICGHTIGVPPATLCRWYQRVRGIPDRSQ